MNGIPTHTQMRITLYINIIYVILRIELANIMLMFSLIYGKP